MVRSIQLEQDLRIAHGLILMMYSSGSSSTVSDELKLRVRPLVACVTPTPQVEQAGKNV